MLSVRENRLVISERLLDLGANVNQKAKVNQHDQMISTAWKNLIKYVILILKSMTQYWYVLQLESDT